MKSTTSKLIAPIILGSALAMASNAAVAQGFVTFEGEGAGTIQLRQYSEGTSSAEFDVLTVCRTPAPDSCSVDFLQPGNDIYQLVDIGQLNGSLNGPITLTFDYVDQITQQPTQGHCSAAPLVPNSSGPGICEFQVPQGATNFAATVTFDAIDQSNVNFTGKNLTGGDFSYIDFTGANFTNATATGANFSHANLTGAILADSDFRNVNFTDANLSSVFMVGADTTGANFDGAN